VISVAGMLAAYQRREGPPNGLELSSPAAPALRHPLDGSFAGKSCSNFPHASPVSCSEL